QDEKDHTRQPTHASRRLCFHTVVRHAVLYLEVSPFARSLRPRRAVLPVGFNSVTCSRFTTARTVPVRSAMAYDRFLSCRTIDNAISRWSDSRVPAAGPES